MINERLRSTLLDRGYTPRDFAEQIGVDTKTVERWISVNRTPHRDTAYRAARLLEVSPGWIWPSLQETRKGANRAEVVAFYPHRSEVPKNTWLELLKKAENKLYLMAYASLFLPEENPEAIAILKAKAAAGADIRICLGDPNSPEVELRGVEEQLFDAIPARVRMALAYYSPLLGVEGVKFNLHRTALYNSIFQFDDEMLVNQHIYGTYGYVAPILHLRKVEGADLFRTYEKSFERVWDASYPFDGNLKPR
ncbi:helix-turn-helix domain-containing protein [Lentzea sp. NBC_00516]|uniref:helix-turn-helix domain-containing protein n=1 Tax=Lentzea sp. NBC_00516 TaxID=2903582 RepID=UPI002E8093F9|nr:helix-turn-helix transcriptional regulator [Lentzea sp. NBC_00516]WUD27971.1 helix-turn-helix domain-containing protein [Lentzea sp. NBC_00516]